MGHQWKQLMAALAQSEGGDNGDVNSTCVKKLNESMGQETTCVRYIMLSFLGSSLLNQLKYFCSTFIRLCVISPNLNFSYINVYVTNVSTLEMMFSP